MKKKESWVYGVILAMLVLFSSCSVWEPDLGEDLLPPGDNVFLFYDTIFDITAHTVSGLPVETSDWYNSSSTMYILGKMEDTITGVSEASMFTQFNTTEGYYPALNTEIDSILFHLYIDDYFGNMDEEFTIRLYEATTRLSKDSLYYSDFDVEGAYNPVALAEMTYTPDDDDTITFLIDDPDFKQKFLEVQSDTALFANDSIFKDYFNGFYLTASSNASEGAIARVGPSNVVTRMTVKYANDSTEVDSTAERDFVWATFGINEYYSQKVNVFDHDYSGTNLLKFMDNPDLEAPLCYVQGMAGVNTALSFSKLDEWLEGGGGKVAITSARLVFDLPPEDLTGISLDDQPDRLMLYAESGDDSLSYLYDRQAIYYNSDYNDSEFGGYIAPRSTGMFFDTTYSYQFKMGLHLQSMIDGADLDNSFRLRLYDTKRNPKVSKLWSNLYTNPKRIRLEVVYIKL